MTAYLCLTYLFHAPPLLSLSLLSSVVCFLYTVVQFLLFSLLLLVVKLLNWGIQNSSKGTYFYYGIVMFVSITSRITFITIDNLFFFCYIIASWKLTQCIHETNNVFLFQWWCVYSPAWCFLVTASCIILYLFLWYLHSCKPPSWEYSKNPPAFCQLSFLLQSCTSESSPKFVSYHKGIASSSLLELIVHVLILCTGGSLQMLEETTLVRVLDGIASPL